MSRITVVIGKELEEWLYYRVLDKNQTYLKSGCKGHRPTISSVANEILVGYAQHEILNEKVRKFVKKKNLCNPKHLEVLFGKSKKVKK